MRIQAESRRRSPGATAAADPAAGPTIATAWSGAAAVPAADQSAVPAPAFRTPPAAAHRGPATGQRLVRGAEATPAARPRSPARAATGRAGAAADHRGP